MSAHKDRKDFRDIRIFRRSMDGAMEIYHVFHRFPEHEEQQGLAADVIRASRTICAKIAAAWGTRHDSYTCLEHLQTAKAQAAETLVFIDMGQALGYIDKQQQEHLFSFYQDLLQRLERLVTRWQAHADSFEDFLGRYDPPEEF
jgi:four helix bundle protein